MGLLGFTIILHDLKLSQEHIDHLIVHYRGRPIMLEQYISIYNIAEFVEDVFQEAQGLKQYSSNVKNLLLFLGLLLLLLLKVNVCLSCTQSHS